MASDPAAPADAAVAPAANAEGEEQPEDEEEDMMPKLPSLKTIAKYLSIFMVAWFIIAPLVLPHSYEINMWSSRTAHDSPTEVMTAVCYAEHGDSSVLEVRKDYPRPVPLPHQILVAVHFTAINPCDYKLRRSPVDWYMWWMSLIVPKPKIPGDDIAGIVVATGADAANRFQIGDRVAAMMPILGTKWGANAQYAAIDADFVANVPANVTLKEAAAMPLVSLTAMQAFAKLTLPPAGQKILIQAGAGGVGSFAVQWAKKILGMEVIATSSARNVDWLEEMGADLVLDYKKQDFTKELKANELDVILDVMSYKYEHYTFQSSVLQENRGHYLNILGSDNLLGDSGYEDTNGMITYINYFTFKMDSYLYQFFGVQSLQYDIIVVNPNGPQLQTVLNEMEKGTIKAVIAKTFPLEKAAKAYDLLEQGHTRGKIVLEVKHSTDGRASEAPHEDIKHGNAGEL